MTAGAGGSRRRPARPGSTLPVWWRCLVCDASGEGYAGADRHTTTTDHGTMTTSRKPE